MMKALSVSLLVLAAFVPALAAATDVCRIACVNDCTGSNVCVIARESGTYECVGAAFGLQGAAVCVDPVNECASWRIALDVGHQCVADVLYMP